MRVFVMLFLYPLSAFCQLDASKWYFGFNGALDFTNNPPTALFNNATKFANEGVSAMSDENGNLLFYSNNGIIWNKHHLNLDNGYSIKGARMLPVKQPGANSIYYLFCSVMQPDTAFCYTVIDMALASGNGSVIAKNVPIFSKGTRMLAGTKHCNGVDVWIVTHAWGNNNYHAFLLTAAGLQTTAVVSSVGSSVSGPNYAVATSVLKLSPTGKKLAAALTDPVNAIEVFDFNNSTGVISGLQSYTLQYSSVSDCEFSPDGSKLYCEFPESAAKLYQWDLCSGAKTFLEDGFVLNMQLAPNGKIYATNPYDTALDEIYSPNAAGLNCNFQRKARSIAPKTCYGRLPTHVSSTYKFGPAITYTVHQDCRSISFNTAAFDSASSHCPATTPSIGGLSWDFGDNSTPSNAVNPVHYYQTHGSYTVKLIIQGPCVADTMRKIVQVPNCTSLSEEWDLSQLIKVLPNPNRGEFYLSLSNTNVLSPEFIIRDARGETIQSGVLHSLDDKLILAGVPPGIYFLEVFNQRGVIGRAKVVVAD